MLWDDLRFALAVARHGSHSKAARALGVAQPTVGRRLAALENSLGAPLFERRDGRLELTALGSEVTKRAERMQEHVLATERAAKAHASALAGSVRLTASDWLVTRVLPALVQRLVALAPELRVDLVSDPRLSSLLHDEADLALRPKRFETNSVWQRAVGHVEFGIFASKSYLSQHSKAGAQAHAGGLDMVLMDDDAGEIADVAWLGRVASRARIVARANGREALAALAVQGAGLACLPTLVGDATHGLVRTDVIGTPPPRTLWLGVHRDRRDLTRVRSVATAVGAVVATALPRPR